MECAKPCWSVENGRVVEAEERRIQVEDGEKETAGGTSGAASEVNYSLYFQRPLARQLVLGRDGSLGTTRNIYSVHDCDRRLFSATERLAVESIVMISMRNDCNCNGVQQAKDHLHASLDYHYHQQILYSTKDTNQITNRHL